MAFGLRTQAGLRRDVNDFVVNGSAPELFLVMFILKEQYTQRKMRNAAPSK